MGRTAGVDLASQASQTALCVIDWDTGAIDNLTVGCTDENIVSVVPQVDRIGIDAPFGWPSPFVNAVTAWHHGDPWAFDAEHSDALAELRFRITDLVVKEEIGRAPLSVSTDLISIAAIRCVRVLSKIANAGSVVDRSGMSGAACEVYPAAALYRWGLPSRGYKRGDDAAGVRAEIVAGVRSSWPEVGLSDEHLATIQSSDHALDAFVAAIVTRLVVEGRTIAPDDTQVGAASAEGWIHLPDDDVATTAGP